MRKIVPYLILNFFVSAAAMLIVLLIWNATHKIPELSNPEISDLFAPSTQTAPPIELPSLDEETFHIKLVLGAGDINLECIQLVSVAREGINLQGWRIKDDHQKEFIFPSLIIYPGGGLNIYTRSGVNTSVELYWGLDAAAWSSGDIVQLIDSEGNIRSTYEIP